MTLQIRRRVRRGLPGRYSPLPRVASRLLLTSSLATLCILEARAEVQLFSRTFLDTGRPSSSFPTNTGGFGEIIIYADTTTEPHRIRGLRWKIRISAGVTKKSPPQPWPYVNQKVLGIYPEDDLFYPMPMDPARNFIAWTDPNGAISERFIAGPTGVVKKGVYPVAEYVFYVPKTNAPGLKNIQVYDVETYDDYGNKVQGSGTTKFIRIIPNMDALQSHPELLPVAWNKVPGNDSWVPTIEVDTAVAGKAIALDLSHDAVNWQSYLTNSVLWTGLYAPTRVVYYEAVNHSVTFFRARAIPTNSLPKPVLPARDVR